MATAANRRLDNLLLWPLVAVVFVVVLFLFYQGWSLALDAPYGLGEEGPAMWASLMLSENKNPYETARLFEQPFQCISFPPVYLALVGCFFKLTGAAFYPMRMVSMCCFVITMVMTYRIFALSGCTQLGRIIGMLTLSSFWTVWAYSFRGRVDMLAMAFILLAIQQYLVLARKKKDDNIFRLPRLIVIATLCVTAAFTKQAVIIVVPAIAAALIIGRQWRLSLAFMGLCTFLSLGICGLLNNATGGGFLAHMAFAAQSPFQWHAVHKHLVWFGSDWLFFLMAPVALVTVIVGYFRDSEGRDGPYRHHLSALVLVATLFVLSSLLGFYALGAEYANVDETMITAFCSAWILALAVDHVRRRALFVMFVSMAVGIYVIFDLSGRMNRAVMSMQLAREAMKAAPIHKRLMLSEDCSVAIDLGCQSEFVDLPTFLQVWKATPGLFEEQMAEIKKRIETKQYGALVINSRDGVLLKPPYYWDEDMIRAVKANYKPIREFNDEGRAQDFYLPKE